MLSGKSTPSVEACQIQALQLLRAVARSQPSLLAQGQQAVAMAFAMAKDQAPSVDDLDEADLQFMLYTSYFHRLYRPLLSFTVLYFNIS